MRLTQRTSQYAAVACAALIALVPGTTIASTATAPLAVTATVVASCSLTTGAVAFSPYNSGSPTPDQAQGSVTVACVTGSAFTNIALGPGKYLSGGSQRNMNDGAGDLLAYSLFKPVGPAPYTCSYGGSPVSWGDNTAGNPYGSPFVPTSTIPGPSGVTYPVCGQIAAGVIAPSGNYTDSVLATLTF